MRAGTDEARRRRERVLIVVLPLVIGVCAFVFLYIITAGLVLAVAAGFAALVLAAGVHYLLWGRVVTADVGPERDRWSDAHHPG